MAPGLLAAALASTFCGAAHAQVVVADFSGPGSGAVKGRVVSALEAEGLELLREADYDAAAARLRVGPESPAEYAAVASAIGATAIVVGDVRRRGRRFTCEVRVIGPDGAERATHTFRGRSARSLQSAVGSGLARALGDALRSAADAEGGGGPARERDAASAAGPASPLVVLAFDGPSGASVRGRVVRALQASGVELVANEAAQAAADELEADLGTDDGRAAVAGELGLAGFVGGETSRRGRRHRATVEAFDGRTGELLGEARFEGRSAGVLQRAVESGLLAELGRDLARAEAPRRSARRSAARGDPDRDRDEDDEDDEDDDDRDPDAPSGPAGPRPSPLYLAADVRLFHRSLSYVDDVFGALREYSLGVGPAVALEAHWYPLAHFTGGTAAHLGLDLRAESSLFLQSTDSTGNDFPTSMTAWGVGLRWRLPVAPAELVAVVGYGVHSFRIEAISVDIPAPEIPGVDYGFVRVGADGQVTLLDGGLRLRARLAYLWLTGTGQLSSAGWFPRSTGGGLELGLGLGYELTPAIEARAGVDLRRYFFSMNPEVGDPMNRIAGGMLDQYLGASVGLAYRWAAEPASE